VARISPRESALVAGAQRLLRERGAWWVKTNPQGLGRAGVPDLIFCYRGRFGGVECKRWGALKRKGGYGVTKLQEYELQKIKGAGGLALVIDSVEALGMALNDIDRELRDGSEWEGA